VGKTFDMIRQRLTLMPPKLTFLIFPSTVNSYFWNVLPGSPTLETASRLVKQFQIFENPAYVGILTSPRGCGYLRSQRGRRSRLL
jgi:hypothetical protein